MNTDNLKTLIDLLNNTDPKEFDMHKTYDSSRQTWCVIGIAYKEVAPNDNLIYLKGLIRSTEYFKNFTGINLVDVQDKKSLVYRQWAYITHQGWAKSIRTNTIEHACYRINRLIQGYEPREIQHELKTHQSY